MLNNNMEYEMDRSSIPINSDLMYFSRQDSNQLVEERSLNFTTSMSEDCESTFAKKSKITRDPMAHRIIEKKRRDRMNNCLADLSKLIPTNLLKQGPGRIEKTEIIEMAIKHIKNLTNLVNTQHETRSGALESILPDRYLGFKECQDEVMRCLVEVEGWDAADQLCIMLMSHLEQAGEKFRIMNDQSLSQVAKEEQYRHADEDMNQQPTGMTHALNPSGQQTEFTTKEGYQTVKSFQTNPSQMKGININQQQSLKGVSGIPSTYPGYMQSQQSRQLTREQLKLEKHLGTLLRSKESQQVEDSGISDAEMGSSNRNYSSQSYNMPNGDSFKAHYEQSSVLNSSAHELSSEKIDTSVYKFKHNITKRFSQEKNKVNTIGTSSSSSRENKRNEKSIRKMRHVISRSPSSSDSSQYPISSVSNNINSPQGGSQNVYEGKTHQGVLPGFILHPDGTHYIPLSIHQSIVRANMFSKSRSSICHPISIPVNFGEQVLNMTMSVQQVKIEDASQSSESMNSPSGCSSMNSADNLSDSSLIPE